MIDLLTVAQVGISCFGCAAFIMVTQESRRLQIAGTVCGIISNPFWWLMVLVTGQWLSIPIHLVYTYGWYSKAWRLWKSRKGESEMNTDISMGSIMRSDKIQEVDLLLLKLCEKVGSLNCIETDYMTKNSVPYRRLVSVIEDRFIKRESQID